MILLQKKVASKILAVFLTLFLILNPGLTHSLVLAEETTSQNQETGEGSQNTADSNSSEQTSVENNNQAEVINDVETEANTGGNLVDDPAGGGALEGEGLGEGEDNLGSQEQDGSEEEGETSEPEIQTNSNSGLMETESTTAGILALNENTGEGSENLAQAVSESQTEVTNDNEAEVENEVDGMAETGENQVEGEESLICTGDADAEVDIVNVVNTNLIGLDFWQMVVNVFGTSENDIDLTQIEGFQYFNPALVSVLAQNENTGDGSVNLALANFLSSFAVYNTNEATLTNNIDLLALSGENQVVGDDGSINTGNARALLDLFNMVNTNLVGSHWFFGVINLFGEYGGDIILPYELEYLLGEGAQEGDLTAAINQNSGEGSTNQALAFSQDSIEVNNSNEACLSNDVDVLANSGENRILGTGDIETGDANASANLNNIVNTNIVGSNWLILIINDFGSWAGDLVNWWGNIITINGTTLAWIKLPVYGDGQSSQTAAINSETGENSENLALGQQSTSLMVENNNQAKVENNVSVTANTGNNQIEGCCGSIETGDAQASANIFNLINTNIVGNNWFFGIINIFDSFLGNIIFPRPDLIIMKSVDKETVGPGDQATFIINYLNQGRLRAENVVISDSLPGGVGFMAASNGGVYQDGKVIWNLGTILPGQGGSLGVVVQVNGNVAEGSNIVNNVQVETTTPEPNQDNNQSSAGIGIFSLTSVSGDTGGDGVGGGPPVCHDQPPGGAPRLIQAIPGENSVTLVWEKAAGPVGYYLTAYGESSGNYVYGNPDVGGPETTSYTIGNLSGGTTYYFVVRAGNGCAPGEFSNELSAIPGGGPISGQAGGFLPGVLGTGEAMAASEEQGLGVSGVMPGTKELLLYVIIFLVSSAYIVNWMKLQLGGINK